jgi:competence protein ComEA
LIWKFQFSRRTLIWILAIAFVSGAGLQITRDSLRVSSLLPVGLVTNTPQAQALKQRADSIMLARQELAAAPVNINTASAAELQQLNGIGPVLSQRIVDYRETNGPFGVLDELQEVKGIGPKKLAAMRDRCTLVSE